jgi:hypothetical protein
MGPAVPSMTLHTDPAAHSDRLAELEAAAFTARQRIEFLWQASHPDWLAIELAVDDLSAAVALIVTEQGLDEEVVA